MKNQKKQPTLFCREHVSNTLFAVLIFASSVLTALWLAFEGLGISGPWFSASISVTLLLFSLKDAIKPDSSKGLTQTLLTSISLLLAYSAIYSAATS